MGTVLQKALKLVVGADALRSLAVKRRPLESLTERELITLESEIGGTLFGPIPSGARREFFCLDEKTWIWYEEYMHATTRRKESFTIRYEIHPEGIVKVREGVRYDVLQGEELENLSAAIRLYYEKIARGLYGRHPYSAQPLL